MKKSNHRTGSALLIVLGMLTFLIVSAVGFATFMRYGRLPSSQLRRTVSGRHLVKAAVAEAIDEIDQAINNNPHPGVGTLSSYGPNRNIWCHRVFMGTNIWNEADYQNSVSPLCLEALAYIPPVLVNEARYFSRLSTAARWKSFDFDVGRYAFCALDVSDYFDVNRLFADKKRSSAPNQRISLSYLFEDVSGSVDHTGVGNGADKWDEFMKKFRTVDDVTCEISFREKFPLISLADFNLALGDAVIGGFVSPFCGYLKRDGGNGFYNTGSDLNADAMVKRMTFVTDGLFPRTARAKVSATVGGGNANASGVETFDMADASVQPFNVKELSKAEPNSSALNLTLTAKNLVGDAKEYWYKILSTPGCASLYDYLDADRMPLSIALPTVERIPMICGVYPAFDGVKIGVIKQMKPEGDTECDVIKGDEKTRTVKKEVRYLLNANLFVEGMRSGAVRVLTVFPFARSDENDGKFELDGRMSLFFSSEEMRLRTGDGPKNDNDRIHLQKEIANTGIDKNTGVIGIRLQMPSAKEIKLPDQVKNESDVVEKHDFPVAQEVQKIASTFSEDGNELLKIEYEWVQTKHTDAQGLEVWTPSFKEVLARNDPKDIVKASTAFPSVKADGSKDDSFDAGKLKEWVMSAGKDVHFNCAFWFRIKDKDSQKIVDMVPACIEDDSIQNGVDASQAQRDFATARVLGDTAFPLLKFNTGVTIKFSVDSLEALSADAAGKDVMFAPKAAIVADPRYNHAPEEWFKVDQEITEEFWVQNNKTKDGGRDRDIFMATSDAGYLQSIYELAFLPRLTELNINGDSKPKNYNSNHPGKDIPNSFEETRNKDLAWRTYDPFVRDRQAFRELPFVNEGSGFKVNPYSDSTNVLMSAFANTPLGWRFASTNKIQGVKTVYADLEMKEFNEKYAFNAYSSDETAKIEWKDLERVAFTMMEQVRNNPGKNWADVFLENMGWDNSDEGKLLGMDVTSAIKLWDADKKFLYGFWRDCFAVKQQLFLIFVRAEPTMMGSGSKGHVPPQLGGKAVALVWRDPNAVKSSGEEGNRRSPPHRTRVLFYRQFD